MLLIDTTVLVYTVGADHPLRSPCRRLVEAVSQGRIQATTTVEVVQEFLHVRARRRSRAEAVTLAEAYATLLAPLIIVGPADLGEGLELYRAHDELGAFDAVLAATARRMGASALVSADRVFAAVSGLPLLDPATPDFGIRLGL